MISSARFLERPSLSYPSLSRLRRVSLNQALFVANAFATLLALATLDVMLQGEEHVAFAETAYSIQPADTAPHAVAQYGP